MVTMSEQVNYLQIESEVVNQLKQVYDPEIPVNIYDLGLIYEILVDEDDKVNIKMTLTAPNCPAVDEMLADIHQKVGEVEGVKGVNVNIVFDPPWDQSMLSDEAKLELGLL